MTTTTAAYLTVSRNIGRYQTMTAASPSVESATAYYRENIDRVDSVAGFVGDFRLLSYALQAYGLGSYANAKALVAKVLEGGTASSSSLANTLHDHRWVAFAKAYDFTAGDSSSFSTSSAIADVTGKYVESTLEENQGQNNVGVELALYFRRVAPTITSAYAILADRNLSEVVQTIFGLPASSSKSVDLQAAEIGKLLPIADLQDAKKLEQLTERFTAMADATYGPGSIATTQLTVSSNSTSSNGSAASSILDGVIGSNGTSLSGVLGSHGGFSNALLTSLQGFRLGG